MLSPIRTVYYRSDNRGDFAFIHGERLCIEEAKELLIAQGLMAGVLQWSYSSNMSENIGGKNSLYFPQKKDYYIILENTEIYRRYH